MPGTLSGELLRFGRALRDEGLPVTPGRMVDAASAVELVGPAQPDDFRAALRASLTTSVDQYPAFERAFDAFWLGRRVVPAVATPNMTTIENRPQGPPVYTLTRVGLEGVDPGGDARLPGGGRTAGDTEILTHKDFADYTAADTPRARRLIQQLVPSLATARSRRFESAPAGAIDMRRTVRAARRYGGDAAVLAFRRPKLRRLRLVALCDVSGSMDIYSNHLLQFCWALQQQGGGGVRTFVFSTRLRDVSGRASSAALRRCPDCARRVRRDLERRHDHRRMPGRFQPHVCEGTGRSANGGHDRQ